MISHEQRASMSNDDADNAPGHSSHLGVSSCSLSNNDTGPLEGKASKRGAEYEQVPVEGGGFKRRRVGAKVWQYRCEHGIQRSNCKQCGGKGLCEHGRIRRQCKECGGKGVCEHGRLRYQCKECGGKGICEHGRRRYQCKECKEPKSQGGGLGEEGAAPPPGITSMETVVI